MKYAFTILAIVTAAHSVAQIDELVLTKDFPITAVAEMDHSIWYSTDTELWTIDPSGVDMKIDDHVGQYRQARFYQQQDQLVYIGWDYLDTDLLRPQIRVVKIGANGVQSVRLSYDEESPYIMDVVHRGDDDIMLLDRKPSETEVHFTNVDKVIAKSHTLPIPQAERLIVTSDDSYIIANSSRLYLVQDGSITKNVSAIVNDVRHYPTDSSLDVLTDTEVITFNYNLNSLSIKPAADEESEKIRSYRYQDSTYVLSTAESGSTISSIAVDGSEVDSHTEDSNVEYSGILRTADHYIRWGSTCNTYHSSVLKISGTGWPQSHHTTDIAISEFSLVVDSMVTSDSQFPSLPNRWHCTYHISIANAGIDTIDQFTILRSGDFFFTTLIHSVEPLAPGELRDYSGRLTLTSSPDNIYLQVNAVTSSIDSDCDNNKVNVTVPVTVDVSDENDIGDFAIFPNPTSGSIYTNIATPYRYQISTLAGSLVKDGAANATEQINISSLARGSYMITVIHDGKRKASRIVKL